MRSIGLHAGAKPAGWLHALYASVLLSAAASAAPVELPAQARILYFEEFATTIDPRATLAGKTSRSRLLKFDAYGRRFELALEPNGKLEQVLAAANPDSRLKLYRGQLTGIDGSWARIATRGADVHGLVWDGADLYVIEPSDTVRDSLVPPLDASKTRTVLFRLADTIVDAGSSMCSADTTAATSGTEAYASLARELTVLKRDTARMQAGSASLRIELAAIGDAKFRDQFASDADALDAMLLRLNNVDGIFDAQVGVEIHVPTTQVFDAATDPLPSTTSSTDLLEQLGALRQRTPALNARGLTHLFTGRDLDGTTVGIGYVNSVCRTKYAVALTEIRGRGAWLESLVTAHEIGHNFGSVHDGEQQCSHVSQNQFLMSPTVHSSAATFSSCSRDLMATSVRTASCITSLPPADLSIAAHLGTLQTTPGQALELQVPVTNLGGRAAQGARIEVLVPPSLVVSDAWVNGGACTSGAGAVDCELGDVAGSSTRTLHLTLAGQTLGSNSLNANISALNDANVLNNAAEGAVIISVEPPAPAPAPLTTPTTQAPIPAAGEAGSGGGGGTSSALLLFALSILGATRARRTLNGPSSARI